MKTSIIVILALITAAQNVAAGGNELGNGGNMIYCSQQPSQSKFYDSYEAATRYSLIPQFSASPIDCSLINGTEVCLKKAVAVATQILTRLASNDVELSKKLTSYISLFEQESKFIRDAEFVRVDDIGISYYPKHCEIHQLVIQHVPMNHAPEDKYYLISADYWTKLNSNEQASALLHEVIYRYALESSKWKITNSQKVRYFNALLLSGKIATLSNDDYDVVKRNTFVAY